MVAMAEDLAAGPKQKVKKKPTPGRGGVLTSLSEDEARVRCIAEIVGAMIQGCRSGENALKSDACRCVVSVKSLL